MKGTDSINRVELLSIPGVKMRFKQAISQCLKGSFSFIFAGLFTFLLFSCNFAIASSDLAAYPVQTEAKMHVVVAIPFRENMPLEPNWYSEEFVTYIANLLPQDQYEVTGYFVSLQNIPKFLDDMFALHLKHENLRVLNFCDGGEWDGYPGISVTKMWEMHAINGLVAVSGANREFLFNSDDKLRMHSYLCKAKLTTLPQALVPYQTVRSIDLNSLLSEAGLDQSWPLFCKLNVGAGALGISHSSICNNMTELKAQLERLNSDFPISDILVQPYLPGPEYTIFVINDKTYAGVRRDFNNHYNLMQEDYLMDEDNIEDEITYYPAPLAVQQVALNAIQAIPGRHHYTRVDLRADGKGNVYVIDINDRPAIGNPSTIKCMLDYNKLSESQMVLDIINSCIK